MRSRKAGAALLAGALGAGLLLTMAAAGPAAADDCGGRAGTCNQGPPPGGQQNGNTYNVTAAIKVTTSGVVRQPSQSEVSASAPYFPCGFDTLTGAEMATPIPKGVYEPPPDIPMHAPPSAAEMAAHAGDSTGATGLWYTPYCIWDSTVGAANGWDWNKWVQFSDQWFLQNGDTWVPKGQVPPVIGIPPQVLIEVARKALTIDPPKVGMSPAAKSYVNLPTWVWEPDWVANPGNETGMIHAEAGGNWAQINVAASGLNLSSPSAGPDVNCSLADSTIAWDPAKPNAKSPCSFVFTRPSSVAPDGQNWPFSVSTTWTPTLTTNPAGIQANPPLQPITATNTQQVPVFEVQTIVTGNPHG